MKTKYLKESNIRNTIRRFLMEQQDETVEQKETKQRCVPENIVQLDEIVGNPGEFVDYAQGVSKRKMGVNSIVDTLGILNNLRLFKIKKGLLLQSFFYFYPMNSSPPPSSGLFWLSRSFFFLLNR